MKIEVISSPNAPRSVGPYSQATRAGDFIVGTELIVDGGMSQL